MLRTVLHQFLPLLSDFPSIQNVVLLEPCMLRIVQFGCYINIDINECVKAPSILG